MPPDEPSARVRGEVAPGLFVRPVNYVADRAVIRRLGDRSCFLGNVHAADPECHDRSFAGVLSLTSDPRPLTTHHHPLADGRNDWAAFAAAVDDARSLLRRDGPVLIHCKAGISRSSAVAATALAAEEGRGFREALTLVQDARPCALPHPALHELGVIYLAAD